MVTMFQCDRGGEASVQTDGTELNVEFVDDWGDGWVRFDIMLNESHKAKMGMDAVVMEPDNIRELATQLEDAADKIEQRRSE